MKKSNKAKTTHQLLVLLNKMMNSISWLKKKIKKILNPWFKLLKLNNLFLSKTKSELLLLKRQKLPKLLQPLMLLEWSKSLQEDLSQSKTRLDKLLLPKEKPLGMPRNKKLIKLKRMPKNRQKKLLN
jgi:hypothetical protein